MSPEARVDRAGVLELGRHGKRGAAIAIVRCSPQAFALLMENLGVPMKARATMDRYTTAIGGKVWRVIVDVRAPPHEFVVMSEEDDRNNP